MILHRDLGRGAAKPCILAFALLLTCCKSSAPPPAVVNNMPPPLTAAPPTSIAPQDGLTRLNGLVAPEARPTTTPFVREVANPPQRASNTVAPSGVLSGQHVATNEEGDVTLNYVDTDIREIVRQILGNILKVNYAIEPGYQGLATIQTARPLKRSELLPTLQALLGQTGGMMTYQNGLFTIAPVGEDTPPPVVDSASYGTGSQAVPLRYASAKQLAAMLEPVIGDNTKLVPDTGRNILVVTGSAAARSNVIELVRLFDVDYLAGQSYGIFAVKSGDPVKLATQLQHALGLDAEGPLSGELNIIPVEQANAIMVIARRPSYLDRATRLINQLNQIGDEGGRNIHVYNLRNVQAQDLQPVLQRAINPPSGGGGETGPGNLPPTSTAAQVTGGSSSGFSSSAASGLQASGAGGTGLGGGGLGGQQLGAAGGAGTPSGSAGGAGSAEALQPDLGSEPTGANSKGPQIIADTKSNALIVVCTESEYAKIEAAIRRLDVLPLQVLIEATVAEVTLNDALTYGTQFFLHTGSLQGTLTNAAAPASTTDNASSFPGALASAAPGFALAKTLGNAQFAIQALRAVTDVKVISSPKLLVLDRQQAKLEVGDLVPIITQSATNVVTSTAAIVNSVNYQQTGVILAVTPRINSGGLVSLDIDQEVSQVVSTTSSSIDSPTFQQRKVTSKVVVQDGETISLAGLIQDTKTNGNSGIPFLQNIPVLGSLFSTRNNSDDRTEILVLITPHVVYNQDTVRSLTAALRGRFSASSAVANAQ